MRARQSLSFETLENRTLLAANDILVENGVLGIRGTPGNDVIQIVNTNPVQPNYLAKYEITRNGQVTHFDSPLDGGVNDIVIFGLAGDDQIIIDDSVKVRTWIQGGAGNDTIKGGTGNDNILGGAGDDTILGGSGEDTIGGAAGNDTIDGGGGRDTLRRQRQRRPPGWRRERFDPRRCR